MSDLIVRKWYFLLLLNNKAVRDLDNCLTWSDSFFFKLEPISCNSWDAPHPKKNSHYKSGQIWPKIIMSLLSLSLWLKSIKCVKNKHLNQRQSINHIKLFFHSLTDEYLSHINELECLKHIFVIIQCPSL